jgi:hypothetical protein
MIGIFCYDHGIFAHWSCEEISTLIIAKESPEGCISVQFVP